MRQFNFTKEEKVPYWKKAERMIQDSGLDLEIEHDSFGICNEGTYVYVKPKKTGKKTIALWEQAKKRVQGFTPRKNSQTGIPHRQRIFVCLYPDPLGGKTCTK